MYKEEDNSWEKFLEKDFEKIITDIHKIVKNTEGYRKSKDEDIQKTKKKVKVIRTITECEDYAYIIKKYSNAEKPLFYADSPYLGSKGYGV